MPSLRPLIALLAAAVLWPSAAAAATPLQDVRLDWTGNEELQRKAFNGQPNYFSAGVSDGTEASYRASLGNVQIIHRTPEGAETLASYATRGWQVAPTGLANNGGRRQIARLYGGAGTLQDDGSATVQWTGKFTVNFYGPLIPFTLTDPVLTIAANGTGTLQADLSGYGSDISTPDVKVPLAPVAGVTIASVTGAALSASSPVTLAPAFAGVSVTTQGGEPPQNTSTPGWGAWPQSFVDFQVQTGLGSYWYTAGGAADAYKAPYPFTVTPNSPKPATDPPVTDAGATPTTPATTDTTPTTPATPTTPTTPVTPAPKATVTAARGTVRLRANRRATLAAVRCAQAACTLSAPTTVVVRIAGRGFRARITVASRLAKGRSGSVVVSLPAAAVRRLKGRTATVRLTLRVTAAGANPVTRTLAVRVTRR